MNNSNNSLARDELSEEKLNNNSLARDELYEEKLEQLTRER